MESPVEVLTRTAYGLLSSGAIAIGRPVSARRSGPVRRALARARERVVHLSRTRRVAQRVNPSTGASTTP